VSNAAMGKPAVSRVREYLLHNGSQVFCTS
jgi:hypothetical protein